jgi:hypothetical protein
MNITAKEKRIIIKLKNLTTHKELDELIIALEQSNKLLGDIVRFQYALFHFNFEPVFYLLKEIIPQLFPYRIIQTKEKHLHSFIYSSIRTNHQNEGYDLIASIKEPSSHYRGANMAKEMAEEYEINKSFNRVYEKRDSINSKNSNLTLIDVEKIITTNYPKLKLNYDDFQFASQILQQTIETWNVNLVKEVFSRTMHIPHIQDRSLAVARLLACNGEIETAELALRNYIKSWSGEELHSVLPVNLIYDPYLKEIVTEDFLQEAIFTPKQEYEIYKK